MGTRMGRQWGQRGAAQHTSCRAKSNGSSNNSRAVKSNDTAQFTTRKRKKAKLAQSNSRKSKRKRKKR
jgi:hypothetical protein